jgi:hypothetical protein
MVGRRKAGEELAAERLPRLSEVGGQELHAGQPRGPRLEHLGARRSVERELRVREVLVDLDPPAAGGSCSRTRAREQKSWRPWASASW